MLLSRVCVTSRNIPSVECCYKFAEQIAQFGVVIRHRLVHSLDSSCTMCRHAEYYRLKAVTWPQLIMLGGRIVNSAPNHFIGFYGDRTANQCHC